MLLIRNIEYMIVENDKEALHSTDLMPVFKTGQEEPIDHINLHTEVVQGRLYYLPDGNIICLGMTEDAAKLLEIPVTAFNEMERATAELRCDNANVNKRLREIKKGLRDRNWFKAFGFAMALLRDARNEKA